MTPFYCIECTQPRFKSFIIQYIIKSLLLNVCPNSFPLKLHNIAFSALRSPTTFENALSLSIDGDQLEPDRSNFIQKPGSIFTLIKVPLQKSDISTRVRRDRPNRQRACSHRIVCQAGDHILEKMKILPVCKSNFLALCFNCETKKYLQIFECLLLVSDDMTSTRSCDYDPVENITKFPKVQTPIYTLPVFQVIPFVR